MQTINERLVALRRWMKENAIYCLFSQVVTPIIVNMRPTTGRLVNGYPFHGLGWYSRSNVASRRLMDGFSLLLQLQRSLWGVSFWLDERTQKGILLLVSG